MYDILIIGAGITGAFLAREMSRYKGRILLLDKESDVGSHATMANSGLIHSGFDAEPGSLKARLAVRGNERYRELEDELGLPLKKTGGLLLARGDEEEKTLRTYYARAMDNDVPALRWLTKAEARKREPVLLDSITAAVDLPTTMVTSPWDVAIRAMENAVENGVELHLSEPVEGITKENGHFLVRTSKRTYQTKIVLNAAGTFADRIAAMAEGESPFAISPSRGEYIVLDRKSAGYLHHALYPVPTKKGKGILLTPQFHGEILLGPTNTDQEDPESAPTTKEGIAAIKEAVEGLVQNIPYRHLIRTFAGIRASSAHRDFFIRPAKDDPAFIHVAAIDSPGLTAAPAIAEYVIAECIAPVFPLRQKQGFQPCLSAPELFRDSVDKDDQLAREPRHGRIVCKCENITEGDLVSHIARTLGANSVKALKKRTRSGSGACQSGVCEVEMVKILAREAGIAPDEVDYYEEDTPILKQRTKVKK